MELYEYFRSFDENELTRGAELYLAGDLELKDVTADKYLRNETADAGFPVTVRLDGEYQERKSDGKIQKKECSLWVYEKRGLIYCSECGCQEYQENHYGCAHLAGLLTGYMIREKGEGIFEGTDLEKKLQAMAMVQNPFEPGVLKRTDDRILSLLQGREQPQLPVWHEPVRIKELIRVESILSKETGKVLLELKAGPGRTYTIRDLPAFLDTYQNRDVYAFGKKEAVLDPVYCEAFSGEILDFLAGLRAAQDNGLYRGTLFTGGTQAKEKRYILLQDREFDRFMELYDEKELELNAVKMSVNLSRKGLKAILKRKAHGASLQIGNVQVLQATGGWLYLFDREGIFRIQADSRTRQQEIQAMLRWTDPMYIRESDVGSVLRELLDFFREYGTVVTKGLDLEEYEPEEPAFTFYLDIEEDEILTCRPCASYQKEGFSCMIYDRDTGAKKRNIREENKVAARIAPMFQNLDEDRGVLTSRLSEEELYEFMKNYLPQLQQLGQVMVTDSLQKKKVQTLPSVRVGVSVRSGNLVLSLAGAGLSDLELGEILSSYSRKKKYHKLKNGAFYSLENQDQDTWETIADLYQHYGKKDPSHVSLPLYRALYLSEMLEKRENAVLEESTDYREFLAAMDPSAFQKENVPSSLQNTLRPYQREGLTWIRILKQSGFGGILADDMGLGKTLQILSFILSEKESGKSGEDLRTLIVCPASLVYNWQKEISVFTPQLSSIVIAGTAAERKELLEKQPEQEIWITSYDLLKRDITQYENICFANEILDEAQFIKNQNTQVSQAVRLIRSSFRMALTGTPIENHLSELWSILDYLMPGFLYSYTKFEKEYELPIVVEKDGQTLDRLRHLIHPFILRRLKKQVLKELPDKLEEVITVRLGSEQKKLYDASAQNLLRSLDQTSDEQLRSGKLEILKELTKLRQICCDPSLLYENYSGESAKLEACLQLIHQAVESGHKLLLFSQFTSMLDIIGKRLTQDAVPFHRIDGTVSKEKRMQMVDSFANDDVQVFCISLKAGGTGLNLTAADIVIHYDPWWNQAAQNQATDRAHRIGQTQTVNVYELIAENTIEEQIEKLKDEKMRLTDDVLTGDAIRSIAIDREDLMRLLSEEKM